MLDALLLGRLGQGWKLLVGDQSCRDGRLGAEPLAHARTDPERVAIASRHAGLPMRSYRTDEQASSGDGGVAWRGGGSCAAVLLAAQLRRRERGRQLRGGDAPPRPHLRLGL